MMKFVGIVGRFIKQTYLLGFARPERWSVVVKPVSTYSAIFSDVMSPRRLEEQRRLCSSLSGTSMNKDADKSEFSDDFVQSRVELVIQEMLHGDIVDKKRSESQLFRSFVETLVRLQVQKNVVKRHFKYYPECYKFVTPIQWQTASLVLRDFGFENNDIAVRLPKQMSVFKASEHDLRTTLNQLKSLGFTTKQLVTICTANPWILVAPLERILSVYEELHQWFSKKDVCLLVVNNPRVLTKDRDRLAEIIDYIQQDMGLDIKATVKSLVFTRPLLRLKTRHQFMVRSGLWTSNSVTNEALPPFKLVVDMNDRYFCKKVAGTSREEYEMFCKMMEAEEEGKEKGGIDSDSDEDEKVEN